MTNKAHVCTVPEVKADSSCGGWEGEEEGEELHRCNPDREDRGVGLLQSTDSSRERTARRALQSAGQEKGGQHAHGHS